jgi:ankyrin repeat protein
MLNKINYLIIVVRLSGLSVIALLGAACATAPSGYVDRQRLSSAIALDDYRYVRALLDAKRITADEIVPGAGYTATPMITVAARHASINVLRHLLAVRADMNAQTPDRDTPLMLAALFGREEQEQNNGAYQRYDMAMRLLVEAGARVESAEQNAFAPLAYAAYAGRDGAVHYLLEKGAKVNANAQGRVSYVNTPLMMAAIQGHRTTALLLLRAGADANVRVHNGMTALEFAQKHKQTQLEKILRCAQALEPGESFRQRCE